jgi:hypothetical protein
VLLTQIEKIPLFVNVKRGILKQVNKCVKNVTTLVRIVLSSKNALFVMGKKSINIKKIKYKNCKIKKLNSKKIIKNLNLFI